MLAPSRIIVLVAFVALLALPFAFQRERAAVREDARQLIIITPHNEQIRHEFGRAFATWHEEHYGEPVEVAWNNPGGTSEIRKMLEAQYAAALEDGRSLGGTADLLLGGGSYEHDKLKGGITVVVGDEKRSAAISAPVDFDQAWLDERFGENVIGSVALYDPDRHWFGTALSGFGIVYNNDLLDELGLDEPTRWVDLTEPRLRSWLALVNPGQSGSVTTAFEIILQRRGWHEGWQILRRAAANARYFAALSSRPPIDVSMGDAAMGVCIDFYGRYQSQAIKEAGGGDRVGYIDPPGETTLDPDPISMLAGAPNPDLAKRFIEFCLTEEGQALWQYAAGAAGDDIGPERFELRRMPIRRAMYVDTHTAHFVDDVDPFGIAAPLDAPNQNYRAYIAVLFQAMAMDTHHELRAAWDAIVDHPAYAAAAERVAADPSRPPMVLADDVDDPTLRAMLERFDAFPEVPGPDGATYSLDDIDALGPVKSGWLRDGWRDEGLWPLEARPADELRRRWGAWFRAEYREIARGGEDAT